MSKLLKKYNSKETVVKIADVLAENRVEFETLYRLLLDKGLITANEYDVMYYKVRNQYLEKYSAEILELSVDEFKELVNEDK